MDDKYLAHCGHLDSALVGATVAIVLDCIDGAIDRKFIAEIGLNSMQFG